MELNPIQQKFDFHPVIWYNFKAKFGSQRLIKPDVHAQGSNETMAGLSEAKNGAKRKESDAED